MEDSIIIGSQVSLSRNITNYPFPHKLSQSESQVITDKVKNIILESEDLFQENFILYRIKDISNIEELNNIENITDLDEQEHLYGEYLNQKRKQIVDGVVSKVGIV